jgi:hypothetical protein
MKKVKNNHSLKRLGGENRGNESETAFKFTVKTARTWGNFPTNPKQCGSSAARKLRNSVENAKHQKFYRI